MTDTTLLLINGGVLLLNLAIYLWGKGKKRTLYAVAISLVAMFIILG
jgi:hypothetical protein